MKKILAIITVAAITAMAGTAMAADTNTLTVSASVTGTCKFSSPSSTLAFGGLDPSIGTDVSTSTDVNFWCTNGVTTDVISATQGLHWSGTKRQMEGPAPADLIPYSLSLSPDSNPNIGPGTVRTLTIGGTVLGSDYIDAKTGSYSDTVVLNITP